MLPSSVRICANERVLGTASSRLVKCEVNRMVMTLVHSEQTYNQVVNTCRLAFRGNLEVRIYLVSLELELRIEYARPRRPEYEMRFFRFQRVCIPGALYSSM